MKAQGTFEVALAPQAADPIGSPTVIRMSIDKQFAGDLTGASQGTMLAVQSGVEGSAGYVAMEQVTGTLQGRNGSFTLQHSSTMTRGAPEQSITVVPDSGSGELAGIAGRMTIEIEGSEHRYRFEYSLPD